LAAIADVSKVIRVVSGLQRRAPIVFGFELKAAAINSPIKQSGSIM
jgi:hypothetical protein